MDHNLKLFFLFYGLSLIPSLIVGFVDRKNKQGILYLALLALTLAIISYVNLWRALGWWSLLVSLALLTFWTLVQHHWNPWEI